MTDVLSENCSPYVPLETAMESFLQIRFCSSLPKEESGPLHGAGSGWQQGPGFWYHAGAPLRA